MELICMGAPLLFFLLSVIDVTFMLKSNESRMRPNRPNRRLLKNRSVYSKADGKDGINSLEYVSEVTIGLDELRNRANYQYNYIKSD